MRIFAGIYVFVVQMRWIAVRRDELRVLGCVLACFTLTLVLSHQGRGDSGGWLGLLLRCPVVSRLRGNDGYSPV